MITNKKTLDIKCKEDELYQDELFLYTDECGNECLYGIDAPRSHAKYGAIVARLNKLTETMTVSEIFKTVEMNNCTVELGGLHFKQ